MITLSFAQRESIGFQYVLDALRPNSPYGEERVRELKPYGRSDRAELLRQLSNVQRVLEGEGSCQKTLDRLLRVFMTVKNIRATVQKCRETALNEIELFEIKCYLLRCSEMLPLFRELQPVLQLEGVSLKDTDGALALLDPEGNRVASFYLTDGSSPLLRSLRKEKRALEEQIRRATGEERESLQAARTLVAAEEEREEGRIRKELSENLRPYISDMLHNMEMIAEIDLTVEKARLARRYGGVMPELTEDTLEMTDMVNPRVLDLLRDQKKTFTPVSIALGKGAAVITGANMGGKSVAMKTIALNVLLTHCGFFPFAGKAAVPLFDSIYIISEDLESVDRGLSSFGGEMVRFNQMVREMEGEFPLVLLDEFARGTNPDEGAAIVQAVTKYLNRQNAVTVLATHYDRVAQWGSAHYQVIGLKELDLDALRKELVGHSGNAGVELISRHMNYGLYRVEDAQDCPRDAVNICRLLDMKDEILQGIDEILANQ
ncbi:MAG: hypothetical protein E7445_04545 [Ruminococcaceae bacterium]|nr:hypothetical protein [Oscillospiraceae bacterium]